MNKTNLFKSAIFIVLFTIILLSLSTLMKKKTIPEIAVSNSITEGFYDEPDNSLDIIYIGSSHMFSSVSPLDLWHDYGFTGYIRASSCQKMWLSYYLLEDALKNQTPKVVVLDMLMFFDDSPQSDGFNREVLDNMPISSLKINAINASIYGKDDEDIKSFIFPLIYYHDRWDSLSETDFTYFINSKHFPTKGFLARPGITLVEMDYSYMDTNTEKAALAPRSMEYFKKINDLCNQNNISLILVKSPTSTWWDGSRYLAVKDVAEQLDIPYIDYNIERDEIAIDWSKESLDGGNHLNYAGALKMTKVFGEYLSNNYDFTDKRNDSAYQQWNEDYTYMKHEVAIATLLQETDFYSYLEKINNPQFVVIINGKEEAFNQITDMQIDAFSKLGLTQPLNSNMSMNSNVFISDGGNVLYQNNSEEVLEYSSVIDDSEFNISSRSYLLGNTFNCLINGVECSKNGRGVNVIIYDKFSHKLLDSVTFDYDASSNIVIMR